EQPKSSFTLDKLQYCIGEDVVFNNTSSNNFTFVWDFEDGVTSNDINAVHKFTKAGDFVVKLNTFQTFPDGTTCSSVTSKTVSVIPQPIATFNSNANVLNCAPFTVKVSATPANASGGVEWNFGDISALDNISQGYQSSHTYDKPGVYLIKSIAYNKTGCVDSTQQVIRITESPIADFVTADTLICGNAKTITFINKTEYGGAGNLGYKWFVNNALISTVKDFTYSFNVASSVILPYVFEVKLVAQSTIGCPDTVIHKIQFNPLPKADFALTQNIGCVPFSPAIKNKSIYADAFKWYLDGVLVSNDVEPSGLVLDVANKTYKLKMVASNIYGCKLDSVERQLNTYSQPKAVFTVLDSVSCNGRLDLKTVNKSTGATRYLWNFGDATPESNVANPSHIYGIAGIYKLTLIAYNNYCSDTSYINIKISNVPKAAFKTNKTNGCTKLEVVFENLSDNAISYLWDFGDGSFSTSKNPTHNYTYQDSPFNVKLIAVGEYGCSDTTIKTNFINIATPPKANFEILPDSVIKIPEYTFNFKNTSEGNPVKFSWDFGDGKTSDKENPSYTYSDTGTYKVRLIVINAEGCPDTLTRIARINGVPGYLFIPNAFEPGSQTVDLRTFKVKGSGIASYEIKIFNKWGQQIWESNALNSDGEPTESWDGMMLGLPAPQGVYIWSAYAKFIDGSEWKGMKYLKGTKRSTGAIHLIR
ncbi:MAG TPA: PKD domain-containing protein, partial [Pelobium sp.]